MLTHTIKYHEFVLPYIPTANTNLNWRIFLRQRLTAAKFNLGEKIDHRRSKIDRSLTFTQKS